MLNGIDISHWQDGINLAKVKHDFVIIKATEGIDFVDPCFHKFIIQAKTDGDCIGVYHFARPEKYSAKQEAAFFHKTIKDFVGEVMLILDWESVGKGNVTWAKVWLDEIHNLTGVKPVIYMSESVVNHYKWESVASGDYGLWVAKYADNKADKNYDMSNAGKKPKVKWWNNYCMWQWTSSGKLTGYKGNLDCDVFYGDKTAWGKYAGVSCKTHIVKDGDTLSGIARQHGLTVDDIVAKNRLITVGQTLRV